MRQKRYVLLAVLTMVLLVVSGCGDKNNDSEQGDSQKEQDNIVQNEEGEEGTAREEVPEKIMRIIHGVVKDGERLVSVQLDDSELIVTVDLLESKETELTTSEIAQLRAEEITDWIVMADEYDEYWDRLTIDFMEAGQVSLKKEDMPVGDDGYRTFEIPLFTDPE